MKKCCQRVNVTHLCSNRKWGRVRAVEMYGAFMMCLSLRKVLFNESLKNPLLLFSCSFVSDSVTPWTATCQASLSFTIFHSLLMYTELVMPSNHLILCCPSLLLTSMFPSIRVLPNESALRNRWSKYRSFSFSISPSSIQGWYPLGLTGLISLLSKRLSRVLSSTTIWKHQFFTLSHFCGPTITSIHDYWKNHSFDYMDLCQQSDLYYF